jgi:hypothetical protein
LDQTKKTKVKENELVKIPMKPLVEKEVLVPLKLTTEEARVNAVVKETTVVKAAPATMVEAMV